MTTHTSQCNMPSPALVMNREIELKYRLTDVDAFERAKKAAMALSDAKQTRFLEQTNYFFDTQELSLKSNSLALRLRRENDHFILSAKGDDPGQVKTRDMMSIRLEYEHVITSEDAHQMLDQRLSPLEYLCTPRERKQNHLEATREFLCSQIKEIIHDKPLKLIGSFSNRRTCVPVSIAGTQLYLEFDETHFAPDMIHYEVELEIPESFDVKAAELFFTDLFKRAHVSYSSSRGKAERFYTFLTAK